MAGFIRLKPGGIEIEPGQRLLRAAAYQEYADAAALIESARSEAEKIRREASAAFEAEKRRGYEEGLRQARLDQAEQMMALVADNIEFIASVERQMAEVVTAAVRKILGEFEEPELTLRLVRQALAVVRDQKRGTLRIAPELADAARAELQRLLAAHPGIGFLEVSPDPRLQPGACLLESELGVVEADLQTQLQALERALRGRIEGASGK
ncbi:MAG TPA: HrpE/YscL family type III secretion apparatus protein [Methylothermaceae bacterium]|nr:HrpE/YscL family type III secretion apparatus protein [Methylothermaceae bacterium]